MAINAKEAPKGGKSIPAMEAGGYPSRVVIIADLGLQPQMYNMEQKEPKREISVTYEHVDEFLKDDDGNDLTDKPRWNTERFALNNLDNLKATSTKRYQALDPNNIHDGDWQKLLTAPITVSLVKQPGKGANAGRDYNKVVGLATMRAKEANALAPLVNQALYFDMDEPDIAVFWKLPAFIRKKITESLKFKGSELEQLIKDNPQPEQKKPEEKKPEPPKQKKKVAKDEDLDDEVPY
jgi:hypothetical protein